MEEKTKIAPVHIFILILMAFSLGSTLGIFTSAESKGVPEAVVMNSDAYQNFASQYAIDSIEIHHNVNSQTHIDTATLVMRVETDYAVLSKSATLSYQYTKSDDLWTLLETDDNPYPSIALKEDNLISHSPWQGRTNNYYSGNPNYSYTLSVESVDTESQTMVISYEIDYETDYADLIVEHRRVQYEHIIGENCYSFYTDPGDNWPYYLQMFTVGCNGIEAHDY